MKKKIGLLVVLFALCLGGVVSAAGLWGTYKGNDIVRLTVEGVPVKVADAPAINYDNRTLVPLYLLQQAGLEYKWDNDTKTVDIKKPGGIAPEVHDQTLDKAKLYASIAMQYRALEALEDKMDLHVMFALLTDQEDLNSNYDPFEDVRDTYNELVDSVNELTAWMNRHNERNDLKQILTMYSDALKAHDASYESLKKFVKSELESDWRSYSNSRGRGDSLSYDAGQKANRGVEKYTDLMINLK
ncbi:stalk domain-containing protein [Paenibacillus daejeonensis]|uniref:stalk domain-containing protein n=1 Tax=Paenibacillus daejeonensis TaxID=135193 RepID=UPI00036BA752|nr:hypothetical protein [Paenibacillus daejeonensis]